MNDLARLDRTHVGRIEAHGGKRVTRKRREFNLLAGTLLVYEHDGANVTNGKLCVWQIAFQHDEVQLIDHD